MLCAPCLLHLYTLGAITCLGPWLEGAGLMTTPSRPSSACACLLQMEGSTAFLREELVPICERAGVKNARVRCICAGQAADLALAHVHVAVHANMQSVPALESSL